MKRAEIFQHYMKEEIARSNMYSILNKLQTSRPIKEKRNFIKKFQFGLLFMSMEYQSHLFVQSSQKQSINIFIKKVGERLLPFIHKHYPEFDYIFWPDLSSSHYFNTNISWMKQNINFVDKCSTPPNIPHARPIENFLGWLVQEMYDGGWQAKSETQIIPLINLKLKKFSISDLQSLIQGITAKLRNIADNGVFF